MRVWSVDAHQRRRNIVSNSKLSTTGHVFRVNTRLLDQSWILWEVLKTHFDVYPHSLSDVKKRPTYWLISVLSVLVFSIRPVCHQPVYTLVFIMMFIVFNCFLLGFCLVLLFWLFFRHTLFSLINSHYCQWCFSVWLSLWSLVPIWILWYIQFLFVCQVRLN